MIRRSPMRTRYRNTGPSAEVVALVWERDRGKCACCGYYCTGERGIDWSVHHRRPRSAGGTRRPWVNLPSNLLILCGHGASYCHGDVERARAWSEERGYIVRSGVRLPSQVPVMHAAFGMFPVLLADDGTWGAA